MPKPSPRRPIVARQVQGAEPVKSRRRKKEAAGSAASAKAGASAGAVAANGIKRKLEVGDNRKGQQQPQKRAKSEVVEAVEGAPKPPRDPNALLFCKGVVDRQAVNCLQRLMEAQLSKTKGASLKSLTMGANITAKKAVYAVTVEVLKCECIDPRHHQFLQQSISTCLCKTSRRPRSGRS